MDGRSWHSQELLPFCQELAPPSQAAPAVAAALKEFWDGQAALLVVAPQPAITPAPVESQADTIHLLFPACVESLQRRC